MKLEDQLTGISVQKEYAAKELEITHAKGKKGELEDSILTTISMAALGLGVDVRKVAQAGLRVTAAVTASLIVLGLISYALIRIAGIP